MSECKKQIQVLSALLNQELNKPDSYLARGIKASKEGHQLTMLRYVDGATLTNGARYQAPNKEIDETLRETINSTLLACTHPNAFHGSQIPVPLAQKDMKCKVTWTYYELVPGSHEHDHHIEISWKEAFLKGVQNTDQLEQEARAINQKLGPEPSEIQHHALLGACIRAQNSLPVCDRILNYLINLRN